MSGGSQPVARFVAVEPVDVEDQTVVDAIRAEWLTRVAVIPGHVGGLLLVDHRARSLVGVSFWADEEAAAATDALAGRIVEGITALTSADQVRMGTCEILVNHPLPVVIPETLPDPVPATAGAS